MCVFSWNISIERLSLHECVTLGNRLVWLSVVVDSCTKQQPKQRVPPTEANKQRTEPLLRQTILSTTLSTSLSLFLHFYFYIFLSFDCIMSVLPGPSLQMARTLKQTTVEELPALSAFQLFCIQLESGGQEASIDAMKRLSLVAITMHDTTTSTNTTSDVVTKLVPYLTQRVLQTNQQQQQQQQQTSLNNTTTNSDELLLLLGQQCMDILSLVGKPHIVEFLPLIERLSSIEETVVRDQAVKLMNALCDIAMTKDDTNHTTTTTTTTEPISSDKNAKIVQVVKRLASADWFTAKVSACGMMAKVLQVQTTQVQPAAAAANASPSSNIVLELCQVFYDLSKDETPMVRRAAAQQLGPVLQQAFVAAGPTQACEFALQCLHLMSDEQDSVRMLAASALATCGTAFGQYNPQWTSQHWLPLVKDASTDMSWYVRINISDFGYSVVWSLPTRVSHTQISISFLCLLLLLIILLLLLSFVVSSSGAFVTIWPNTFPMWPSIWVSVMIALSMNNPWSWRVTYHS